MTLRGFIGAFALSIGMLMAPSAKAQEFEVAVDGNFTEERMQFSGGIAPPYIYVWDIRLVDGRIAVCGSGHLRDARLGSTIRGILRDSEVTMNGQIYPINLNFFTRARTSNSIYAQPATCQFVAAYNGGEVSFRMGSGTWRN